MDVFGKQQSGKYRYDHSILEQNIENILKKIGAPHETELYDDREDCSRTFVVAKRHLALDSSAVLFRSNTPGRFAFAASRLKNHSRMAS